MTPRATYRLQFHKGFTFADAAALTPYFAKLGISHIYASPILTARAGSAHGYDVVDPARVNPELGGEDGLRALAASLHGAGLGIILDIVPNHLAVGGADNPYWLDVLEKGRDSVFANLFDIDWEPAQPNLRDKVLVPFLGKRLAEAIEARDITLIWDRSLGKFAFAYGEHRFPLRREDYPLIAKDDEDPAQAKLDAFNEPDALRPLLEQQNFRLAYWRGAGDRINWRRFFDISGLAAVRIEDNANFEIVHATIFRIYAEGLIDGLRIDHVDGLADPRAYCRRLRARLEALLPQRESKERPYIVVEKILARGETLPSDWDVDGTTGYDFMDDVSSLQHDERNGEAFATLWAEISARSPHFETEERIARREILTNAFGNALRMTAAAFRALAGDTAGEAAPFEQALALILERFRAYRTYATGDSPEPPPGPIFEAVYESAMRHAKGAVLTALEAIADTMRGDKAVLGEPARDAVRRFNQLAAPVAAKAVEDTAFYRYGRLLSRNDVGFVPGCFGLDRAAFFARLQDRHSAYPKSLLATATHDHKRGEDVRARLAAVSEIPELWEWEVRQWFALNAPLRGNEIALGDEYQLYQTLVGCWPPDIGEHCEPPAEFVERILAWQRKSLREAKLETSWTERNPQFETRNADFVRAILDPHRSPGFLARLRRFAEALAPAGICNSLVQCVLRYTSPGVPDLFQGTELWDFSLVDPDNRRAVGFAIREELATDASPQALLMPWRSGQVKLALIKRLLALRASAAECFDKGDFRPIEVRGPRAGHVVAFSRCAAGKHVLVAVPRLCATECMERNAPLPGSRYWTGTAIVPSEELQRLEWRDVLDSGATITGVDCAMLFSAFPAAVLISDR